MKFRWNVLAISRGSKYEASYFLFIDDIKFSFKLDSQQLLALKEQEGVRNAIGIKD